MPNVDAYRRAPLANPVFVPLSDASVQINGDYQHITDRVLDAVNIAAISPFDAVLASKLGGYEELPPVPVLAAEESEWLNDPHGFVLRARAALLIASSNQDKEALRRLIESMRLFLNIVPELSEEALQPLGADALRLTSELYRRTGASFLLNLLEQLRSLLPDVSGLMHSFPFTKSYTPQDMAGMEENIVCYHQRMERFATGNLMADALAITAHLALYSGSSRDGAAGKAGIAALARYHGAPTGAFMADPYLAGRDPSRAVDLPAFCAQIEALCDLLMAGGDISIADRLDSLIFNALPDFLPEEGIRTLQPINRLPMDDSSEAVSPEPEDSSRLLRALYAIRRSVWLAKENDEIALMLPLDSGCLTRVDGVPVRLTARTEGSFEKRLVISVESRQPASFTLYLRVPAYVTEAGVSVSGGKEQAVRTGTMFAVRRTFRSGDVVVLRMLSLPRTEVGYRGSVSVLCGPHLMALPLPEEDAGWQFALLPDEPLTPIEEDGEFCVLAAATDAPAWESRNGFIMPPTQGVPVGAEYRLTLLPFARTVGRIAMFPKAVHRE